MTPCLQPFNADAVWRFLQKGASKKYHLLASNAMKVLMLLQANELELALDVYNQLLREGCQPNLVTYNILIDIYGKMGSWQEAVQVLDALEGQVGCSRGDSYR